ncbi:glycosyltransferase [Mycobacterium sp. 663a-19]|uniref:glycosyltransferase n=1 Tax=Mycobacterium sp. 663a-19 TaxID=2986148 RepID=UPI002D1E6E98|nr:glycosyltransferase [Mycobacterium sp. 663a-19]MEB3982119.1 glycosyltransferase [Mycobacterium sp. 663a-19]
MKLALVSGDDVVGEDPMRLCAALAARGQDVTAYVRQTDQPPPEGAPDGTCRAVGIRVGPPSARKDADLLPFVGEWAATLERLWSSDRPDIVHAHGWLGGLAAQLAARRQKLPTVQTFQDLALTSPPRTAARRRKVTERERLEPLLARNADWVTVESSADVDPLARLRHGRARVSVLASGVDVEQFTSVGPALERTDRHRVLCLAPNPLPGNGFDIAIRVMPKVPDAELVIAETDATDRNHSKARNGLKHLAAELGVADRVRFAGTLGGDELSMLLRSADVLACAPRRPPRPAPALAAMASGVAVVALPVGVLADVVIDSVTGVLAGNPHEFAASLRSLLAQQFQCQSMGSAGRSRALSRFTWDRIALDALNIYRQVGSQRSPAPSLQGAR